MRHMVNDEGISFVTVVSLSGQQIRSKIDSFQNANFLSSQPKPYDVTTHWNRLGKTISMRVTS